VNYHRLDINLLPSELQPGPAVRYALIANFAILAVTIAYLALDSTTGWLALAQARSERTRLTEQRDAGAQVISDYNQLVGIRDKVQNYIRLVGMTSTDYVDLPVVLDRVSKILPEGVYLERVATDGSTPETSGIEVLFALRSAQRDPDLVLRTLNAFKQDNLLANCYMPVLDAEEQPLADLLLQSGINWSVTGLEETDTQTLPQFRFEIRALVERNFAGITLPVLQDDSAFLAQVNMPTGAIGAAAPPAGSAPPPATAPPTAGGATSAPPTGVTVSEVH
jgi:hypothetical protein